MYAVQDWKPDFDLILFRAIVNVSTKFVHVIKTEECFGVEISFSFSILFHSLSANCIDTFVHRRQKLILTRCQKYDVRQTKTFFDSRTVYVFMHTSIRAVKQNQLLTGDKINMWTPLWRIHFIGISWIGISTFSFTRDMHLKIERKVTIYNRYDEQTHTRHKSLSFYEFFIWTITKQDMKLNAKKRIKENRK